MSTFVREGQTTGRPRLLLTAAVAAGKDIIDAAYDIPAISRYFTKIAGWHYSRTCLLSILMPFVMCGFFFSLKILSPVCFFLKEM